MSSAEFRAWDYIDKEMLFANIYEMQDIDGEWTAWEQPIDSPENRGISFDIMQYVGRKDNEGVKVFDGDIIKGFTSSGTTNARFIGKVVVDLPYITVVGVKQYKWKYCSITDIMNFKVIGNIYENPEMLGDLDENNSQ